MPFQRGCLNGTDLRHTKAMGMLNMVPMSKFCDMKSRVNSMGRNSVSTAMASFISLVSSHSAL